MERELTKGGKCFFLKKREIKRLKWPAIALSHENGKISSNDHPCWMSP